MAESHYRFPPSFIPGVACPPGPPARWQDGPQADSRYTGTSHKEQSAAPTGCGRRGAVCDAACQAVPEAPRPPPPRTFFGLGAGDLQVAVSCLQLLTAHDLPLEVAQGDVEAVEGDRPVLQRGRELVVDARHGRGQVLPAPRGRLLRQTVSRPPRRVRARGSARKGPARGVGQAARAELGWAGGAQSLRRSTITRPRGLRQTRLAEASELHPSGAARPRPPPPQRLRPAALSNRAGPWRRRPLGFSSQPRQAGGRRGEAPAAPARPPLPLARSAPRPDRWLWQLGRPCLSVLLRAFPAANCTGCRKPLTAHAQWHTTPAPPASHGTQRIMTKGPRHVGVAAPPSPPRAGGGLSAPGLSPPGVLPPPGPVLSLPSPHGPSPPSGTSRQPLGLCWLSQQPWAHHRPISWHPPACHHPLSPPLSSQPGQGKTAWGRCSGLCRLAPGCPCCRASKGRGRLRLLESISVHLWKVRSKKPMTRSLYCHKPRYFPPVAHPRLLELWAGGLQRKEGT